MREGAAFVRASHTLEKVPPDTSLRGLKAGAGETPPLSSASPILPPNPNFLRPFKKKKKRKRSLGVTAAGGTVG